MFTKISTKLWDKCGIWEKVKFKQIVGNSSCGKNVGSSLFWIGIGMVDWSIIGNGLEDWSRIGDSIHVCIISVFGKGKLLSEPAKL